MSKEELFDIVLCFWIIPFSVLFIIVYLVRNVLFNLKPVVLLEKIKIKTKVKKVLDIPSNVKELHFCIVSELKDPSGKKILIKIRNLTNGEVRKIQLDDISSVYIEKELSEIGSGGKYELTFQYLGTSKLLLDFYVTKRMTEKQRKLSLVTLIVIILISIVIVLLGLKDFLFS